MKEVKKCSISGVAFTLDADAYEALEAYLESLKKAYGTTAGGSEIVADIEARIAELILSAQDNTPVVEKPLVEHIIAQLGSAEDISAQDPDSDLHHDTPRIPRRLYRDTENAKLGGVCAGIGRYFDVDPVWIRLGMFLPLVLACFRWLPFMDWTGPMMGNLFGIFVTCYLIMWFAVPAARTARQRLEMNGERITAQSIRETTEAATAAADPDAKAKPIVAEAVSVFGKVVVILLKILAGLIVFGLIISAGALIISLFALIIGGSGFFSPAMFGISVSIWLASLGIIVVLIPIILLIYVLMCLVASRKPGGRAVLVLFLLWIAAIIACGSVAIHEYAGTNTDCCSQRILNTPVVIDSDTTTLGAMLHNAESESVIDASENRMRISIPSKQIDLTIDKEQGEMQLEAGGNRLTLRTDQSTRNASVQLQERVVETRQTNE